MSVARSAIDMDGVPDPFDDVLQLPNHRAVNIVPPLNARQDVIDPPEGDTASDGTCVASRGLHEHVGSTRDH